MLFSRVVLGFAALQGTAYAVTDANAEQSFHVLQSWYNASIGLWIPSTGWWNSANCLTVVANLAAIDSNVKQEALSVFPQTFYKAQRYNLQMQKVIGANWLPHSYYGQHWPKFPPGWHRPPFITTSGFLNGYYDDEGWWGLAWVAVYDVTGDHRYLQAAEDIFDDMAKAYGTTPCGGLWWDRANTYVNAIANELFLDLAAHLANRVRSKSSYYLDYAKEEWAWFQRSGMINSQNLINDGLDNATCENNGGIVWSYNQGVILGGLAELSQATGDRSYLQVAKNIADSAINSLTDDNGVLHDVCEPDCGGDGSQFKGVFARNLQILNKASPEDRFAAFLEKNADSVWTNDQSNGQMSLVWSGPFVQPANASTQSSAMDAVVAALASR
ncbi:glycoside hydrolase family 76 protein [Polychaeton citri CBS 116435]|uniref:Glycoside hydrolase family 76 protein n=1 Tax=Polychaeton citri CBS 116435 TaxID=1314669 RepID=A0A9P4QIB8_9PEZI|nr:glycoside hydrolase family 76 protein [Polychaeton citri CBS 116435]